MFVRMTTLSGVRVNLFNENFLNESEQDANSVLTELDKGLRSTKVGVQCEAIVRFPRLFEKYPFPILINSSFLKLAEFFWNGNNLLRFWVLRVCQQSEKHLDKIINIEAFSKRIFMVIHSNDPIARALTLRTLGAISRVIPEKQQVHHALRRALDSGDTVEVEAAIYASGQFAAQSRTFAISMCAKISDMIESLNVPVPMKLLLIPILRYMHHDANTASLVKELCLKLLPKYPAESFVIAILDSLTELSARTLTGVPDQVQLLLLFLDDKRRIEVRKQSLKSLSTLANKECVHAWPKPAIGEFTAKARACENPREQWAYLNILLKLSNCSITCHVLLDSYQDAILELCVHCISQLDFTTASEALAVLAALGSYAEEEKHAVSEDIMHIINMHVESLLLCIIDEEKYPDDLKQILCSSIRVANFNAKFGVWFVEQISDLLCDDIEIPPRNSELICTALAALCSHFQLQKFGIDMDGTKQSTVENSSQQKVYSMLDRLSMILYKLNSIIDKPNQIPSVEILGAVVMQILIGCFAPKEVVQFIDRCSESTPRWTQYRLARSACRYGQSFIAARILSNISSTVVDKLNFFLLCLSQVCQAECILNYGVTYKYICGNYSTVEIHATTPEENTAATPDSPYMSLMQRLEAAINLYWQALASLRASSSPIHGFNFQVEFLKLRAQFLQTLHFALTVKNAQIIVPPPAIAISLSQNSRDYLQKFGHVTNQLRKVVKMLRSCKESYARLYKSSFDADPITLEFLEISEYQCDLFAHIVENICYMTPSDPSISVVGQYPETSYFAARCREMEAVALNLPQENSNAKTISNRHLEVLVAEIDLIVCTPLCLPRYFFQVLQSTQIKLSINPQPRSPGEPVIVQSGSNLVIKVEGVIQHYGKKRALFRGVDAVQLSLTSQLMTQRSGDAPKIANDTVTLTQIVKPQRDFLSGSFLLPISSGGQFQVTLETYVVDESGITWYTGPKNSMMVRVLDDPTKASTTAAQAGQTRRF